jgi:chemotaxis protein CheD
VEILTVKEVTSPQKSFVLGGQVVVPDEPRELVTILGSCVSVCLWDKKLRTGGMNHFLLPETINNAKSLDGGISATRALIQSMIRKASIIKNLEAQVFGGANRFFKDESFLNVGRQNVEAARIALEETGVRIVHQDTGGEPGRKIYFNTQTGMVLIQKINYTLPKLK